MFGQVNTRGKSVYLVNLKKQYHHIDRIIHIHEVLQRQKRHKSEMEITNARDFLILPPTPEPSFSPPPT